MYIIVFALIGLTTVHPLAPILLSSFALSTNAITFIASIPILVGNDALLGTAFGVWKSFVSGRHVATSRTGLTFRQIATVSF
jgi:nitrate/nitrite transporter NarK